jgi:hypothetical protein
MIHTTHNPQFSRHYDLLNIQHFHGTNYQHFIYEHFIPDKVEIRMHVLVACMHNEFCIVVRYED